MKNKNSGFTLIELIAVVLMIGVVATIMGMSAVTVSSAKAQRCANSVDAMISKCRTDCLGRAGDVHLTISLDSKGNVQGDYYENGVISRTETIPASGVSVSYTTSTGTVALSDFPLTLSFARSTGGQNFQPDGISYCTAIKFTGGGKTISIKLVPSTGNHKLM
ncbi:MAG: type II secretion system protein [Clostridia bacterium]|nr:type II secretion system protein [Clostridia bacterium]